jgi:hypothetical protein
MISTGVRGFQVDGPMLCRDTFTIHSLPLEYNNVRKILATRQTLCIFDSGLRWLTLACSHIPTGDLGDSLVHDTEERLEGYERRDHRASGLYQDQVRHPKPLMEASPTCPREDP